MFPSAIIFILSVLAASAQAVTEQEYLVKNKTYTDQLIAFYLDEETNKIQFDKMKAEQKHFETELKKATATLGGIQKNLNETTALLAQLKNKQTNKDQLEANLKSQKQQNSSKINQLNSQVSNLNSSLQSVQLTLTQLESEKSLIQQRINTQRQLAHLAESNIFNLEFDLRNLDQRINNNRNKIQDLRSEIQILRAQKEATQDPQQKQAIQNRIDNKRNQISHLENDIQLASSSKSNKQLQLVNERADLNQANSNLSSLAIQFNGKQNEINSQLSRKNQLSQQISSLNSEKITLSNQNKNIDSELLLLTQLPQHIQSAEQNISSLNNSKLQQEVVQSSLQAQLTAQNQNVAQLQNTISTQLQNVLSSEREHDDDLKKFLGQLVSSPIDMAFNPENIISIDSVVVSQKLAESKDWSVFKGVSTTLNADICAASTRVLDTTVGFVSELMVVKIVKGDGSFSSPFVVTTHSLIPGLVVAGQLKTDKNKAVVMPLLQSPVSYEGALISRYSDNEKVMSVLKADNTARVEFTIPQAPVEMTFSLRGSSAMIRELSKVCANN